MQPLASVVLCATPRSGSTLLCDLLTATGTCGVPHSFFRRQSIPNWAEHFGLTMAQTAPEFDAAYLAATIKEGTDASGTFGLRLMWESVSELSARLDRVFPQQPDDAARFELAFGPVLYIHLSRRDKVAQAVSRLKAHQSGLWHRNADGSDRERFETSQTLTYDANALDAFIAEAKDSDRLWEDWFDKNSVSPARIVYEDLSNDPAAALGHLLDAIGRDPALAQHIAPATAKLSDAQSIEWATRYRAERKMGQGTTE